VGRASAVALLLITGCAALGGVDDGTSLALGYHNDGRLVNGVQLPTRGDGYVMPPTWARRGNNWGTEELVGLLVRTGRRLADDVTDASLYIADLSPPRGGPSAWHRSHQTGRDVDLIFFARDALGKPVAPPAQMMTFGDDGKTLDGLASFDTERNWKLVRALLVDPEVDVQYLFIYEPLAKRLIEHARASHEPPDLVARAEALLKQPTDSLKHDDHLHVRIYCPASDRALGCRDRGPLRWFKKVYKYLTGVKKLEAVLPQALRAIAMRPFCHFLPPRVTATR
jgi:penicillin-insensitive murein DD-endopeptidase